MVYVVVVDDWAVVDGTTVVDAFLKLLELERIRVGGGVSADGGEHRRQHQQQGQDQTRLTEEEHGKENGNK